MGLLGNIRKKLKLPGIRRHKDSLYDSFINNYGWSFTKANKITGDLQTYYEAYNNVYVKACIKSYSKYSLLNGYSIKNKDDTEINTATTRYLTSLFDDPQGKYSQDTFAILNNQIWTSLKLTGDTFIEVNTSEEFGSIPLGFKFIPTELMVYHKDTAQWGLRNTEYCFEDDEIIHIYDPHINLQNHMWGVSEIDSIGLAIALEYQGMKHNRDIFDNNGLDPRGILSFDGGLSPMQMEANIKRLKASENEKGVIAVQNANYQSINNTNKDMDFMNLMLYARDRVLVGFQVPPAIIGIVETASLGSGTGEAQEKSFHKTLKGDCKTIENAFNKVLGRSGFREIFEYNTIDLDNKLTKTQIEDLQVKNGVKYINEIRSAYGLDPVPWGNTPMNYGMFGVSNTPEDTSDVVPIGGSDTSSLEKALLLERVQNEYLKK